MPWYRQFCIDGRLTSFRPVSRTPVVPTEKLNHTVMRFHCCFEWIWQLALTPPIQIPYSPDVQNAQLFKDVIYHWHAYSTTALTKEIVKSISVFQFLLPTDEDESSRNKRSTKAWGGHFKSQHGTLSDQVWLKKEYYVITFFMSCFLLLAFLCFAKIVNYY